MRHYAPKMKLSIRTHIGGFPNTCKSEGCDQRRYFEAGHAAHRLTWLDLSDTARFEILQLMKPPISCWNSKDIIGGEKNYRTMIGGGKVGQSPLVWSVGKKVRRFFRHRVPYPALA